MRSLFSPDTETGTGPLPSNLTWSSGLRPPSFEISIRRELLPQVL